MKKLLLVLFLGLILMGTVTSCMSNHTCQAMKVGNLVKRRSALAAAAFTATRSSR